MVSSISLHHKYGAAAVAHNKTCVFITAVGWNKVSLANYNRQDV